MKLIVSLPALALGLLLAAPAAAQHHADMTKGGYDPRSGGGDPDTPPGCTGIDAKIEINSDALAFSPSTVTIDVGQPVC